MSQNPLEKWRPDLEFWQVLWFFVNLATNHSVQVTCLNFGIEMIHFDMESTTCLCDD